MFGGTFGKAALRGLVLSSIAGLVVAAAPARAELDCGAGGRQRTLALKVRSADNILRLGDTARFSVRVVRNAQQVVDDLHQPAAESSVNTESPAAGAEVIISLNSGDVALHGAAITDDEGRATVSFKIRRWMTAGPADLDAFARISYDTPCRLGGVEEWGSVRRNAYTDISG